MASQEVNLTGTSWLENVPSVFYSASGTIASLFDPQGGSLLGKATLPSGLVIAMTINIIKDPNNPGKVIASTTLATGITYIVAEAAFTQAVASLAVGVAAASTGIVMTPIAVSFSAAGVIAVASYVVGSELQSQLYKAIQSFEDFEKGYFFSPEVTGYATQSQLILQSAANDPDFCKRIFPEYVRYRQITEIKSGSESFLYNNLTKKATITTATPTDATKIILDKTQASSLNLNGQPLDIRNLSAIELRNAVSHIDKVSFLLSEINIRVGEKLDMGGFGIYTVKGGDTLSQIAASHSMVTKDLVMLNTWLIDDGRIKFNYPTKVLIDAGTIVNSVWFMRSEREVA